MSGQAIPPNQQQIDYAKWLEELKRRDAERAHDKLDEFHRYVNEATVKTGEVALRMSLLINGGAAVALLTFIGTLPKEQKFAMANTLVWFASGVALAVVAIAASYFTNYFMAGIASSKLRTWEHPFIQPGPKTRRNTLLNIIFHILAVLAGLASIATFVCGMLEVRNAFTHLV